jgi:glycosyltransferase involved in cell wall biosynthesis
MQKICFIAPRFYPVIGGTENLCKEILDFLDLSRKNSDFSLSLITTPEPTRNKKHFEYKIYDCGQRSFSLMKEHFELFQYDLVIFFADLHDSFLNSYKPEWAKKNVCVLNLDERTYQNKEIFQNATKNLILFDKVITFTKDGVANKFLEEQGIKNKYIQNFSRDTLLTQLDEQVIEKINLDKTKKTILYNAAFEERKNQLDTIHRIVKSTKLLNYNWIFIGPINDVEYYKKCVHASIDKENIKFIKSTKNLKIVDMLYQISDMSILCSIAEGMPLVLLESLSANKPILATPTGGIRGVLGVELGDNYILSGIDYQTEELENKIYSCLENKEIDYRKLWKDKFDKEIVCLEYKKLIQDQLKK